MLLNCIPNVLQWFIIDKLNRLGFVEVNYVAAFEEFELEFVVSIGKAGINIDGLQSTVASQIYSHAQMQEQDWEEKNRIRDLEEKRAMSGASVVNVAGSGGNAPKADEGDMFASLEKAKKLFDSGAISDTEYQELKAKIISKGA